MITDVIKEIIYIFNETAIYMLFGFFIAGILRTFVPSEKIIKYMGKGNFSSVLMASLLGVPIPLCSCGVLPTAMSLKKQGASKGATVSFMISTPETGVDSISITYALIDPIMTVFRPVAAFITAITAGHFVNRFDNKPRVEGGDSNDACAYDSEEGHEQYEKVVKEKGRLSGLLHYAYVELLDDIVFWLLIGIVVAGFISALVPASFFEQYMSGFMSLFIMVLVGIPIYMCAASSTPIAAAMILKGLSPGAALVFLLTGPATNVGTIAAIGKYLGKKTMAIYLASIVLTSIYLGFILNMVYSAMKINPTAIVGQASEVMPPSIKLLGSLVLLFLIIRNLWNIGFENALRSLNDKLNEFTGFRIKLNKKHLEPILKSKDLFVKLLPLIVIAIYLLSGFSVIQPGEAGIKKRFGKVIERDLGPGLHYLLPYPVDSIIRMKESYVNRLSFESSLGSDNKALKEPLVLTGDENMLNNRYTIFYRIKDSYDYIFTAAAGESLIKSYAWAAITETVGAEEKDSILTSGRNGLQKKIQRRLQKYLDAHSSGIQVLSVQLVYSHSPDDVHYASRDVASAVEDKNTKINQAQKYRNDVTLVAKGEAEKILIEAQAYKTDKINSALGEAEAFTTKALAFRDAEDITKTRMYIETMETVLPDINKIVKPASSPNRTFDFWFLNYKEQGPGKIAIN